MIMSAWKYPPRKSVSRETRQMLQDFIEWLCWLTFAMLALAVLAHGAGVIDFIQHGDFQFELGH